MIIYNIKIFTKLYLITSKRGITTKNKKYKTDSVTSKDGTKNGHRQMGNDSRSLFS